MMVQAVALKVEQVAIRFGGLVALSNLNFTVGEGEIVSLIGPNGAGKTTAFNVITGFLRPTHGTVSYRGTTLNGLKPHEIADFGLIRTFQRSSVFPNDTVYDNLMIGLHRQGEQAFSRPFSACRGHASRNAGCINAPANFSNGSGCTVAPLIRRARSPMANNAWSAWRWRSPRSRRCCCSMNRSRA